MTGGRIAVVGLGPAGVDLLVPAARAAIARAPRRYVRTVRHPVVAELAEEGVTFASFDHLYDELDDLDAVYERIVSELLVAARTGGEVVYAVPGNPGVAERSVARLTSAAARGDVTMVVVPGLSFADLAWARVGVDPMAGGRVVDGHRFAVDASGLDGPLLIAQCDTSFVLGDIKLALLESLPPDAPVVVLARLGLPDENVRTVALEELDRAVVPDHLTSLFVDTGSTRVAAEFARLVELADRLRGPGGCPWDAEQTHHSLARYLLEEAYEVVEAVERLPFDAPAGDVDPDTYRAVEDELGDLLYQVIFHAMLGREAGAFTIGDVCVGIHDKLVRRHPHVFGATEADTSADVMRHWEQIKKVEKGTDSMVVGITPGLPSLLYTHKLLRKAGSIGLELDATEAWGNASDALARLGHAPSERVEQVLGDLLAALVAFARARGVDAESSLRAWAGRYRDRFVQMELDARARGVDLHTAPPDDVAGLWAGTAMGANAERRTS